jgi:Tfp pilus assembly protein PilO
MSRRAPLLVGLASVGLALLMFFLLVFPKMREVGEAKEELEAAQSEQISLEAELARLEAIREEAPKIRRQVARIRRQVPPVADLPGVINLLQDAAETANVDFFAVSPQNPTAAVVAAAAEVPAQIQVIGSFFSVNEFLFRLENLRRAAKVTSVAVSEGPDNLPQLQINMSVMFYTTDMSAGPGATAPEATEATPGQPEGAPEGTEITPEPSPSPVEGV